MLYGVAGLLACLVTALLASAVWPNRKPTAGWVWARRTAGKQEDPHAG